MSMEENKAHFVNKNHKYEQYSNCNNGNYGSNRNKQTIERKRTWALLFQPASERSTEQPLIIHCELDSPSRDSVV